MTTVQRNRTALVTGGTGYVGSRLAQHLVSEGWDVHIIVRPSSDLALLEPVRSSLTVHRHDGSTQRMIEIVAASQPSIVFHLASLFLAQHRHEDVEPLVMSNILFGTQLVEAMTANGIHRLINAGTSWQHYRNAVYDPVCLYAATKQAFETMLHYYLSTAPLSVITLKLFDTYGPGDPRPKLFTILQKAAADGQPLAMSPGEQLIDLVYIDDVIRAFQIAAERILYVASTINEKYAVSSGAPIRLRDLIEEYCRISGRFLSIHWGARPYRVREVMVPWSKGAQLPDWKPLVSLQEGLQRTISISKQ